MSLRSLQITGFAACLVLTVGMLAALVSMEQEDVVVETRPSDTPVMVRLGNPDGPCGVTVHASSVEELEKVGIEKWIARCNATVTGPSEL
jgi:hypothetical protein